MNFLERLPKPHPGIVNQGITSPSVRVMRSLIVEPRTDYTGECQNPTVAEFKRMVRTESVGPFRATGIVPALDSLRMIFAQVKSELPELHAVLGSAGMLCCRFKRISGQVVEEPSNHSWGTAIDIKIDGQLDNQGDDQCFRGLLLLAKFFNAARWVWGVSFPVEDAMHFEASAELIRDWKRAGLV